MRNPVVCGLALLFILFLSGCTTDDLSTISASSESSAQSNSSSCALPLLKSATSSKVGMSNSTVLSSKTSTSDDTSRTPVFDKTGKIDRLGFPINPPQEVNRIISFSPGITQMLVGLGLGNKLVAVDYYSAYHKIDGVPTNTPSINMDVSDLDVNYIKSLKPDVVVMPSKYAAIDAVDDPFFAPLRNSGLCIVYLTSSTSDDNNTFEDLEKDILLLGQITSTSSRANDIVSAMQNSIDYIKKIASTITTQKKTYFDGNNFQDFDTDVISYGVGTLQYQSITDVGGFNMYTDDPSDTIMVIPKNDVAKDNPDVILIDDYTGSISPRTIKKRAGFSATNAVKNNQIFNISDSLTERSQCSVKMLYAIAKVIYPDQYGKLPPLDPSMFPDIH